MMNDEQKARIRALIFLVIERKRLWEIARVDYVDAMIRFEAADKLRRLYEVGPEGFPLPSERRRKAR